MDGRAINEASKLFADCSPNEPDVRGQIRPQIDISGLPFPVAEIISCPDVKRLEEGSVEAVGVGQQLGGVRVLSSNNKISELAQSFFFFFKLQKPTQRKTSQPSLTHLNLTKAVSNLKLEPSF